MHIFPTTVYLMGLRVVVTARGVCHCVPILDQNDYDEREEKEVDEERTMTGKTVLRESLKLIYSTANLFFHS